MIRAQEKKTVVGADKHSNKITGLTSRDIGT